MSQVPIADKVVLGDGSLVLIAGPCVIESEGHAIGLARTVSAIARNAGLPYIFKASFDKANRSSRTSFRGHGMEAGLKILDKVKRELKLPVLTDVHERWRKGQGPQTLSGELRVELRRLGAHQGREVRRLEHEAATGENPATPAIVIAGLAVSLWTLVALVATGAEAAMLVVSFQPEPAD